MMEENKNNDEQIDIDIPDNMIKYKELIEKICGDYENVIKEAADKFDGKDVMLLIGTITRTIADMKVVIEDLKEVDGDDRITIFNILFSLIIKKTIVSSDNLSEEDKKQIETAFATGGIVQTILEAVRDSLKALYTKMDSNKDNYVSKNEYQKYIESKTNLSCAKCFTSCCFPILSCCDPKGIKIPN